MLHTDKGGCLAGMKQAHQGQGCMPTQPGYGNDLRQAMGTFQTTKHVSPWQLVYQ